LANHFESDKELSAIRLEDRKKVD